MILKKKLQFLNVSNSKTTEPNVNLLYIFGIRRKRSISSSENIQGVRGNSLNFSPIKKTQLRYWYVITNHTIKIFWLDKTNTHPNNNCSKSMAVSVAANSTHNKAKVV